MDCIVVVEGTCDARALHRAVRAPAYVCNGEGVKSRTWELPYLAELHRKHRIVVFTDPDRIGRSIREHLNSSIPGLHHAFISVPEGSKAGTNVGVENASPAAILAAMQQARESYGGDRREFSVADMQRWAMAGSWDGSIKVLGPSIKRHAVCAALGIDNVATVKGLVSMLNRYFSRETVEAAVARASVLMMEQAAEEGGDQLEAEQ
ncbi:MAG: hypothetical protein WDW36_002385 [Sanguina aurantia]